VQLGFCTNVLPGETVEAIHDQLGRIATRVRRELGWPRLGVGLWIAHEAAAALAADAGRRRALRQALDDAGLACFTLNGFPYGGFHAPRVKERVFVPGWDDGARVRYTIDLATILVDLLPDDVSEGTISTVPLGHAGIDWAAATRNLVDAAIRLPPAIRLCLEPEPGSFLENVASAASLLGRFGPPMADRVGVCFDTCHAAVVGEDPAAAFAALAGASLRCGKVQISSALVLHRPDDDAERAVLASFDEPRFYHQVRGPGGGAMDLPEALERLDRRGPWRIHFHVPIHRDRFGVLGTTRDAIRPAVREALAAGVTQYEVETYTWSVLPEGERPDGDDALAAGLARELAWARELLAAAAPGERAP
jgi:sugar phosphate isomerase/epimerase